MNNITYEQFKNTDEYSTFISENKGEGYLMIRAYTASEAIPIQNMKIIVKLVKDNYNIIFFEGLTDESGMIPKINLPAPIYNSDNLVAPLFTTYDIDATYNNKTYDYKVNLYDDICVLQNINVIPNLKENREGKFYYGG